MKKNVLVIAIFMVAILFSNGVSAQKFPKLDISPADISLFPRRGEVKITKIVYSRPQLKGRTVESLTPEGEIWRLGANEASEITFYKDVVFGGKKVKAGTYTLFAIPSKSEWTMILNKNLNLWGTYSYKKENDVVRITAKVSEGEEFVEAFSITYSKEGDIILGWGKKIVTIPVK